MPAKKSELKPWPADGSYVPAEQLVEGVLKLLRDTYKLQRKGRTVPPYVGYGLGTKDLAGQPNVDEQFQPDMLAYHRARGRDILDIAAYMLLNLGIEQGRRLAAEDSRSDLRDQELIGYCRGLLQGLDTSESKKAKLRAETASTLDFYKTRRPSLMAEDPTKLKPFPAGDVVLNAKARQKIKVIRKLWQDLSGAKTAALQAAKGDDGGSCNFDACALKGGADVGRALRLAGLTSRSGSGRLWRGYWLIDPPPPVNGQAAVRTRQAEAMEKHLKALKYEVTVYYQAD
jgi:hypothetical protein